MTHPFLMDFLSLSVKANSTVFVVCIRQILKIIWRIFCCADTQWRRQFLLSVYYKFLGILKLIWLIFLLCRHPVAQTVFIVCGRQIFGDLKTNLADFVAVQTPVAQTGILKLIWRIFSLCRHPVAQSTDSIRGKMAYTEGLHIWEIHWPLRQRGTHAVVGVATKEAPLHSPGKTQFRDDFFKGTRARDRIEIFGRKWIYLGQDKNLYRFLNF